MSSNTIKAVFMLAALVGMGYSFDVATQGKPLKVYILAGQSNMQGSAHQRTFAAIGEDPQTTSMLNDILDSNGDPIVCEQAWITYLTDNGDGNATRSGQVKVGYFVRFGKALAEAMLELGRE